MFDSGEESSGTGFLFQILDGDKMGIALISNRHVFGDGTGEIELRFHAATADKSEFDLGSTIVLAGAGFDDKYIPHPVDEVDLGAALVNAIGREGKGLTLLPTHIASPAQLDDLRCGTQVFFVGYPDAWRDEVHNLPLMRAGTIASLPKLPFDGRPEFVIDAQAFPGSSGSPVFAVFDGEMKLIGVLAETAMRPSPVSGAPASIDTFTADEIVGLGFVIRSSELPPLIDAVRTRMRELIAERQEDAN